jgi:autophagy-related protein 2
MKARVLLLRLTIPVDIYSSPIVVEVDGVECQLRVLSLLDHINNTSTSHTNHDRKRKRPQSRNSAKSRSRTRSRNSRKASDLIDDGDIDPAIPTAVDLAESFLQTEPREEKAELEAAILSQTQDLGASTETIDDGDSDVPVGTGSALTLPAFMARFLQGIVDRLQVRVHGITINLDVDLPNEASQSTPSNKTDPMTVQIKVDNVDIEGVTHELAKTPLTDDGSQKLLHKDGKRLIRLSNIRGAVISEASLFSSLARSCAFSSPSATQSDFFEERRAATKSRSTNRETGPGTSDGTSSPDHGSQASASGHFSGTFPPRTDSIHPLHGSTIASDSGRFDDALEDEDSPSISKSIPDDFRSDIGDGVFRNSACLDQFAESQYSEYNYNEERGNEPVGEANKIHASDPRLRSPLSTPRASIHMSPSQSRPTSYFDSRISNDQRPQSMLQSTILPTRPRSRFSEERVSRSQPILPAEAVTNIDNNPSRHQAFPSPSAIDDPDEFAEANNDSTPVGEEDLAQSQLFSHEDAESMYMSAVTHGSASARIPGAWEQPSSDSDDARSEPGSPTSFRLQSKSLDNLEHARHIIPTRSSPGPNALEYSTATMSETSQTLRRATTLSPATPQHAAASIQHVPCMIQTSSSVSERSSTSSEDYTRMTKQVFGLDQIAIYLPSAADSEMSSDTADVASGNTMINGTFDGQGDISRSVAPNVPGAFTAHSTTRQPSPPGATTAPRAAKPTYETTSIDTSVHVVLGHLYSQFDISVGRLILKLFYKIKEALKQETPVTDALRIEPTGKSMDLKFRAERISVKFLERLEGTLGSVGASIDGEEWAKPPQADVLLRTTFRGLNVNMNASQLSTETSLSLKKFVFGYALENIVSFDAGLQIRTSVRDLAASAGVDVSVKVVQNSGTTHCQVHTLPVHVSIDLQRLDETFSWFGGLSSVLNMGSSMASNATITATPPSKSKSRGVHFETPIRPEAKSLTAQNKAETRLRIGGFVLDLLGKECSISMETTAVKIVSGEGIVAAIDKIRLSGPHLKHSNDDPAISAEMTATRIEYLPSPKDVDLDRLLSLITPSKAKYDQDDDILLDTLLRQRKQGAVLKLTVDVFSARLGRLEELNYLPELGEEISRLSTVAKYLPDDDRPGLLSLVTVRKFDSHIDVNDRIGTLQFAAKDIKVAQITLPALVAFSINTLSAHRNGAEEILGTATDADLREPRSRAPAIMARMIGDEMEPIVKFKLWNLKAEYRVSTLVTLLDLAESITTDDISASLTASIATLTDIARVAVSTSAPKGAMKAGKSSNSASKPMTIDVVIRDCIFGLNPLALPSKVLVVLTEAHVSAVLPKDQNINIIAEMSKASLLVIDNVANLTTGDVAGRTRRQSFDGGSSQVEDLCAMGFVSVSYISSAKAIVQVTGSDDGEQCIDVELRDDLFVLESCADSTQTLVAVLNGLKPPTPPSKETRYRTKVIPVKDLLASLSGDAFGTAEGDYDFDDDFGTISASNRPEGEEEPDNLNFDSNYYHDESEESYNEAILEDEDAEGSLASMQLTLKDTVDGVLLESFAEQQEVHSSGTLDFQEDHFGTRSILEGTTHRWNSAKNTYDGPNEHKGRKSPLKVCIRDVHIIWNLFDGYDWQHTRDTITKAVQDVESKAIEKRARNERRPTFDQDMDDEETVIGDFLFNSIYIGIPANRDPRELAAAINQELNDNATETESIATTTLSSSPSRQGSARRSKTKKLHLNRSERHKITFELRGVCVDLVALPPGSGETQSSVDVRVHDLEIFDHIPTSTWRKFATYMQDAGERETGTSMIHIEILNVKPIPELAASEIVLKVTILPLRLHVDQDALDFITRFFEFKDESATNPSSPGDVPFLQRVEVNSVKVKLDFKPKRVDYAGLRSGHTTEFMNFLILDEADMELRHTIIYGISGFDKLGKCLNDIWMPDIKRNQLPGILAGLAPVRSLVNVGGGFQQLFFVPMYEYKKDGRIVRSISKGAAAFAKTTGTELIKLGAKVAIGVQTVLQGAEDFLGPSEPSQEAGIEEGDTDEENKKISLYANQPVGVFQGLRGGYSGLQRDLILARDAIIAVPGEVMEVGTAEGVLRAVRKHAPTVILRPAIGIAKAGGQILMGATNSLDPVNLQRADAVSHLLLMSLMNDGLLTFDRNIRSIDDVTVYEGHGMLIS